MHTWVSQAGCWAGAPALAHLCVRLAGLTQSPADLGCGEGSHWPTCSLTGPPSVPPPLPPAPSRVPRALGSALRGWCRFTSLLLLPLSKSSTDLPQTQEETWHSPLSRSERLCNRAHKLCKCLLAGLFGSAGPELGRSPPHPPPVLDCLLPLPTPP